MKAIKIFLASMSFIMGCFIAIWWNALHYRSTAANTSVSTAHYLQTGQAEESNQLIIVLDAGHGGYDSGSVSQSGVQEKEITLTLTLKIGERLTAAGIEVVYTKTTDEVSWENDNLSDLRTRVSIAEDADADYYISIHTNFSAYQDGAMGFESYLDDTNYATVSIAQQIHTNLAALHFSTDRGLKSTSESSLYVIDHNSVPALLLEVGFLSDEHDTWYLINEQDQLADAIAQGIIDSCL